MKNVLIIDDDRETREVLRTHPRLKDGIRVRVERHPSRALKQILHHKFDFDRAAAACDDLNRADKSASTAQRTDSGPLLCSDTTSQESEV